MKIIVAGGSGFIGRFLEKRLMEDGIEVCILSRDPKGNNDIYWDGENMGDWTSQLEDADVLINLAGRSVDCRYNDVNKKAIFDSRLKSTAVLGEALRLSVNPPKVWLNSSTATIYRHAEDRPMNEETGEIGSGFSVDVATQWEDTFFESNNPNIRKVALRTAIVLGNGGGAYAHFRGLTKVGFGGRQGNGNQMVSWIHKEDVYQSILYLIKDQDITGVVNLSSPNPLTNKEFMASFRQVFKRPFGIPTKKWMLTIGAFVLQTETELLLKSRWVLPTRLVELGYDFKYPKLDDALKDLAK